jgi:hypothetical protein
MGQRAIGRALPVGALGGQYAGSAGADEDGHAIGAVSHTGPGDGQIESVRPERRVGQAMVAAVEPAQPFRQRLRFNPVHPSGETT